jgi:hypothetical protein
LSLTDNHDSRYKNLAPAGHGLPVFQTANFESSE